MTLAEDWGPWQLAFKRLKTTNFGPERTSAELCFFDSTGDNETTDEPVRITWSVFRGIFGR